MGRSDTSLRLPGGFAAAFATVTTTALLLLGANSMFYETWGQPLPALLQPLLPGIVCLACCLVALRSPRAGGVLLIALVIGSAASWVSRQAGRGTSPEIMIFTLVSMHAPTLITAGFFLVEARCRRLLRERGAQPSPRWIGRNWRPLLIAGVPLLALAAQLATGLPPLLARADDGLRGARLIEGNGITLVWAPQGPGWNWRQPDGEYPSWDMIARYGVEPVGLAGKDRRARPPATPEDMQRTCLCAYLNEDGTALLPEPARIWRMPEADEIVRSLTRGGENAGCVWDGESPHATCRKPPDKETPLWAPDQPPIYYWAAGQADSANGACVNYTGGVNRMPKGTRARGIGFRCVKEMANSRPATQP